MEKQRSGTWVTTTIKLWRLKVIRARVSLILLLAKALVVLPPAQALLPLAHHLPAPPAAVTLRLQIGRVAAAVTAPTVKMAVHLSTSLGWVITQKMKS